MDTSQSSSADFNWDPIKRVLLVVVLPLSFLLNVYFFSGWEANYEYNTSVLSSNIPLSSQLAKGAKPEEIIDLDQDQINLEDQQLNIVLFYADDWTMKVLGKLNPLVRTPNIDKMADNGIVFRQNCVTTSICWMSRATLMTGLYTARHQQTYAWKNNNIFDLHPWNETLFPLLREAGYYTGLVGKWHGPQVRKNMNMAFDHKKLYYGRHWETRDGQTRHVTDLNREDALKFLKIRPRSKKFALQVSFFATHAWDGHYPSYHPQNTSKSWYNETFVPMPKTNTEKHFKELPPFFTNNNEGRRRWRKRFEPDYYQDNIRDLYRMATEVDAAIGEIIKELKNQGVYDNTLLLFTTDNGNLNGEHGLAEKWYPFEESIRVPLVISDPRMAKEKHGTFNDEFTLNVDLAPTLLGAAGIAPSSFMQGRDIANLYLKADPKWRKDFFYEYNRGDPVTAENHTTIRHIDASFALVTKEWKYIYWPQHKYEQLFHRAVDMYEERDLIRNDTILQTKDKIYFKMKARYNFLKRWSQQGKRV